MGRQPDRRRRHRHNALEEGDRSLEEVFQVDAHPASFKVDTAEGHARRLFVQKVYSVLAIALVITLFSGLLGLVLAQLTFVDELDHRHLVEQVERTELINIIVAISLCLTFLNWCAASYLGLRLLQANFDLTAFLLICWAAQLIWFFVLVGLWLFVRKCWPWAMVCWAFAGLLLSLLQLAIHTQMVSGGGGDGDFGGDHFGGGDQKRKKKFIFTSNQLLLATLSLYVDSVMIFTLVTPITGALVAALQQLTSNSADLLPKDGLLRDV